MEIRYSVDLTCWLCDNIIFNCKYSAQSPFHFEAYHTTLPVSWAPVSPPVSETLLRIWSLCFGFESSSCLFKPATLNNELRSVGISVTRTTVGGQWEREGREPRCSDLVWNWCGRVVNRVVWWNCHSIKGLLCCGDWVWNSIIVELWWCYWC